LDQDDIQKEKLTALGSFAGGVAHDLNNLLMAVLGHVSYVRMSNPNLSIDSLEAAEMGIKRAAKLTQQILDFARKTENLDDVKCDICELVKSSIPLVSPSLPENINLGLKLQEPTILLAADESQLTQIVLNLLVNARDAMPNGGKISIGIEKVILNQKTTINGFILEEGRYCRLRVADQGHGMPANIKDQIFDPFFTTKRGTGTGIGLATVFFIVKSLKGAIDVTSEVNAGSTFNVFIPLYETELNFEYKAEPVKSSVSSSSKASTISNADGKYKILVVDDEDSVRLVLEKSLELLGYEVESAENGNEALKAFSKDPMSWSLIVMDMIMPNMSGDQLFYLLKDLNKDIKVLISSGYSSDGKTQELLKNGASGFIQKPFAIEELAKEVEIVLNS